MMLNTKIYMKFQKNYSKWKQYIWENSLFVGLMETLLPVPLTIFEIFHISDKWSLEQTDKFLLYLQISLTHLILNFTV
jgi:hypothetical protein